MLLQLQLPLVLHATPSRAARARLNEAGNHMTTMAKPLINGHGWQHGLQQAHKNYSNAKIITTVILPHGRTLAAHMTYHIVNVAEGVHVCVQLEGGGMPHGC